jgi:hypothetical protein
MNRRIALKIVKGSLCGDPKAARRHNHYQVEKALDALKGDPRLRAIVGKWLRSLNVSTSKDLPEADCD